MPEIIPNWHPMLVHFTIGLLSIGTLFYIASLLLPSQRLALQSLLAARWTLVAGVLITIGTVLAGWYAYDTVQHDDPSHAAMTDHRNWALVTAALFAVIVVWDVVRARQGRKAGVAVATGLLLAAVLLGVTGFKGGEVVYRYGIGVMSLPEVDDHAHSDEEGAHRDESGSDEHRSEESGSAHTEDAAEAEPDHHDSETGSSGVADVGSGEHAEDSADSRATQSAQDTADQASGDGHNDDGHTH